MAPQRATVNPVTRPTPSDKELQTARLLLGIDKKYAQPFQGEDPFNPGIVLQGVLSLKPDDSYGSLLLTRVDGAECSQLVRATPKLRYPFDKGGGFRFPPAREVHFYDKLDGTNILSYCYQRPDGGVAVSHKLRLAPFVRNGRWGDFLDMWKSMLRDYPQIPEVVLESGCNLSFEMFGKENEHLVRYDTDLDIALLFGVKRGTGGVVPPHKLRQGGIPTAKLLGGASPDVELEEAYGKMRQELEKGNSKIGEGKIAGSEGSVWYIQEPGGRTSMWKCKPESVEEIHWATGINKAAVMATCWNALESSDVLDYATLEPLLLEEYQHDDIIKFRGHIDACINEVNSSNAFREGVRRAYSEIKSSGMDIETDKARVMRALSQKFPKDQMSKVYGAIAGRGR